MPKEKDILLYLAEKGAFYNQVEISTITISKELGTSQQTISRKLIELEADNLIERIASTRGIKITLTPKGRETLDRLHLRLKHLLSKKKKILIGTVESGLGEGSYYLSLKPYVEQIKEKFGFTPYKGTLNLRVNYSEFIQFVMNQQKITIEGFTTTTRTFGPITAYKITLGTLPAAVILPERTSHERDVIEVISEDNLRDKLKLKDNDKVEVYPC